MSATVYDVGETVTLQVEWRVGGVLTDATTQLEIKKPDGTVQTVGSGSLAHPSTGTYKYDYLVASAGRHAYRFEATGAVTGAEQEAFTARPEAT